MEDRIYFCIDQRTFFATVECVARGLDPMTTNLVVADPERSVNTICLAITPAMKALGIKNRCRIKDIPPNMDYITATPRMQLYVDCAAEIYSVFLRYKPAKESKASAYRCATSAIKERVTVKGVSGTEVYRIYCRDNKKEDAEFITRELVKETLNSRTNEYRKLANICFDKENEVIFVENELMDPDVDVHAYCQQAQELYDRYCTCYTTDQVDAVIDDILQRVQANKISIHGNLFFIPKQFLPLLNLLEDYIVAISEHNLNSGLVMSNSMFVVDDDRQRQKMTDEFYANYKKDIAFYQERVQHFINSGCESKAVIKRWLDKINALQQKKATYEEILRRRLDDLNQDYAMLQMQSQELAVRNCKGQIKMPIAA